MSATYLLVIVSILASRSEALIEEIEATPTNTNAFELGELSMPQFFVMMVIFFKFVLLYALEIIPISFDLGYVDPIKTMLQGFNPDDERSLAIKYSKTNLQSLLLECPLQYVCELDFWAHRDQDSFSGKLIATWFKNSNHTWTNPKAAAFAGAGTCQEMYPCPFDVQEAVGWRIPGSNHTAYAAENSIDYYMDFADN